MGLLKELKTRLLTRKSKKTKEVVYADDVNKIIRELEIEVENIICSGYWRNDISGYMKRNIFGLPNGKVSIAFYDARKKVREILPKKRKEE